MRRLTGGRAAVLITAAVAAAAAVGGVDGQVNVINRRGNGNGRVLPWQAGDGHGQSWFVYQPWMVQMQGNFALYQQAAAVTVNGSQPQGIPAAAHVEEKTGELVMESMPVGQLVMTRRVWVNADDGSCRVIDLLKNPTGQDQPLNMTLASNVSYAVQSTQQIADPKRPGQTLAWAALVQAGQQRVALDVYAGPGAKVVPAIDSQNNNNAVQATVTTTVPAGKEVGFVHWHVVVGGGMDAANQWVRDVRPAKLLADLPAAVRREIVNVAGTSGVGDVEVLRGDLLDVVELRTGDKFNGTLTAPSYKLATFYGTVDLPADKVVGVVNVGQFRPRQLVVTGDGQVFGGHLEAAAVDLELTSGQRTRIPIAQVARFGYRKRPNEADTPVDETTVPTPYAVMTTGERVGVELAPTPVPVVTRYGSLRLPTAVIASIVFNGDEAGTVHTINLTDGSRFTGLVTAPAFDAKLTSTGATATAPTTNPTTNPTGDHGGPHAGQAVRLSVGMLNRLVFTRPAADDGAAAAAAADPPAALQVHGGDVLAGVVQGDLKLDTAFDTIALRGPEVRSLAKSKDAVGELVVTTWDGTKFNGQLEDGELAVRLASGIDVTVPVGLLDAYSNPGAAVPPAVAEKVKLLVADLNADDWKQRDAATQQLVKLGPGVVGTLKTLRDAAPAEAQQRIDSIVKQLQKPDAK